MPPKAQLGTDLHCQYIKTGDLYLGVQPEERQQPAVGELLLKPSVDKSNHSAVTGQHRQVHLPSKIAKQRNLREKKQGAVSSRRESEEDLRGNFYSEIQRPTDPSAFLPTTQSAADARDCSTSIPTPRNLSKQYNQICKTHKRLVKSGSVRCSVSLSDSPPTVYPSISSSSSNSGLRDLPSAPSSPLPDPEPQGASVHFGAVGEFSGFKTPLSTPERPSVIQVGPPRLPPRSISLHPPPVHPKSSAVPVVKQPLAPSPRLLQSVTEILQELHSIPDSSLQQSSEAEISPILLSGATRPRLRTSTDANFLREEISTQEGEASQSSEKENTKDNNIMGPRVEQESKRLMRLER